MSDDKNKKTQEIIVKGIVSNKNGLVLLLKTKSGYWDLPGGHLGFEETPEECLQRECKEEIGQKVNIKGLSSTQTIILDGQNRKPSELRHYTVLVYRCKLSSPNKMLVLTDKNIVQAKWFSQQEIIEKIERLPALTILREQLLKQTKSRIKTTSKIYLRMGELNPYRKIKYRKK